MTLRRTSSLAAIVIAAVLAGCAQPVKLDQPAPVEARPPAPAETTAPAAPPTTAAPSPTPQTQVTTVELERQRAQREASELAATLPRVIYFDFDSYVVKPEFQAAVEGHARVLTTLRDRRISLEGHTDERGGREYNLALGQKRAEAVVRALELLGVNPAQLEAVSFGKERPADPRSNEEAWAKNRRVEIRDR